MNKIFLSCSLLIAGAFFSQAALAAELPEHAKYLQEFSYDSLPANLENFYVSSGASAENLSQKILNILSPGAKSFKQADLTNGTYEYTTDNHWTVKLAASGNAGSIFSQEMEQVAFQNKIPLAKALSDEQVANVSVKLLKNNFAQIFPLAEDEELVPVRVGKGVYSVLDDTTKQMVQTVDRYYISFARKKAGLYFLGGGSFVRMSLGPTGELVELEFDWPTYSLLSTSRAPKLSSKETLMARSQQIVSRLRTASDAASLSKQIKMCGYYDPGAQKRTQGHVAQLACAIVDKSKNKDKSLLMLVPAAETPLGDASWQELSLMK